MNENTKKCPICPKECDLSDPHCGRSEEYAKIGKLPDQEHGKGAEETKKLAEKLEKLSEHWMKMAPDKPYHHGRRHG